MHYLPPFFFFDDAAPFFTPFVVLSSSTSTLTRGNTISLNFVNTSSALRLAVLKTILPRLSSLSSKRTLIVGSDLKLNEILLILIGSVDIFYQYKDFNSFFELTYLSDTMSVL